MKPASGSAVRAESTVNDGSGAPSKAADAPLDPSDDELVRRAQEGDEEAFRGLFDRYNRRAFAVAVSVVKNRQDAFDVVQEAFVKVHRHIGNFQGSSAFFTWLYRIVMNLCIDHLRRAKRARALEYDDGIRRSTEDLAGDGSLLPRILDGNPRKTIMRRELSQAIEDALDKLPEYHRAVILLREVEGLSYEEMSHVLKVPKGTIMSRLFHARKKMQESLSVYMNGDLEIGE
ncbi:MAG: sigma-70 family RNA polymerase sigma factor [Myxococcales bacterium]|nr:sigma-70 family RNA polymerase sigma factor [Myxococcales bacterium]